jgi:hypothetical protein
MYIKSKHIFIYKWSSATYFGHKSHLQTEHKLIVRNIYYSALNVMDEILSYIMMEVL